MWYQGLSAVILTAFQYLLPMAAPVLRKPLTVDDYIASRYTLHLFDLCLVNDGAVCLIVSRADKARDQVPNPVLVAGWGESKVRSNKLDAMVRERRPGILRKPIDLFDECYTKI